MSASREIQRLRYLAAMGVPVYVTRRALPGAAPSNKLALKKPLKPPVHAAGVGPSQVPEAAASYGSSPLTRAARPSPAAATALRESLRTDAQKRTPQTPARPQNGAPKRPADAPAAVRFRLAALVCAGRLWVEELGDAALASEQVQLIHAIGRALQHAEAAVPAPLVTEFQWPMHANLQLDLGAEEASASLQGFLQRQLDENACVELLCLGDPARRLLDGLALPCARRIVPSTRELLAEPLLKRDLWTLLNT